MATATIDEINAAVATYTQAPDVKSAVGVFVGGTAGIGLSTAFSFAKLTVNSPGPVSIYIAGRSQSKADDAEATLKQINPRVQFHFLQHDLTSLKETKKLTDRILQNESKVNLLVVSQGSFPSYNRVLTEEGVDDDFATSYYSRWAVVNALIPKLSAAAQEGEPARVISVLAAGREMPANWIDTTDFMSEKRPGLLRHLGLRNTYNTLAVLRFARLYPKIAFVHTSPGLVKTKSVLDFAWYFRMLVEFLFLLHHTTPEQSGDEHIYLGLALPTFATGGHLVQFWKGKMKEVFPENERDGTGLSDPVLQDKLWEHTQQTIEAVLAH